MSDAGKRSPLGRAGLCVALIFLLYGVAGVGTSKGEDAVSSKTSGEEPEIRSDEMARALEKAESLITPKAAKGVPEAAGSGLSVLNTTDGNAVNLEEKDGSPKDTGPGKKAQVVEAEIRGSEKSGVPGDKETSGAAKASGGEKKTSSGKDSADALLEESRVEYAVLENVNWDTSDKKVVMRLWFSDQATPEFKMTREKQGMKIRLRIKGLATRMRRTFKPALLGVESAYIREDPKAAKKWGLEPPYYAVGEIRALFMMPVKYKTRQDPGVLEITFLFPQKIEEEKEEKELPPEETIEDLQKKALASPINTRGPNYKSQVQYADHVIYGVRKPTTIADLYQKKQELAEVKVQSAEFNVEGDLPEDVWPLVRSQHPAFGSADYFKRNISGSIGQSFDFTNNYNNGTTSPFGEGDNRAEPGSATSPGKDIGTILWTPEMAVLFNVKPGTFNVSTGYSTSRDFPTTNNNFVFGLSRQAVNLNLGYYFSNRYMLSLANDVSFYGGTTRQKINGKWQKTQSQRSYQGTSTLGFNARVGKRFVWGINNTAGTTWFQSNSNGSQGRDVTGAVNLYTIYMWKPWLTLQTGVDLSSIFKDTGSNGSDPAPADTSNMSLGTTLKLSNRFDMTLGLQLQGGFSSFSSNSNSGSNSNLLSGSVGFVYKVSRENTLNLGLSSAIIQDDTAKIQPGSENTSNGYGITQQRSVSMDLGYKMRIGKATCNLGVNYTSAGNVSGSTGGDSGSNSSGDYTFSAGLSYPVWGKRASLGLTYSFEYAPATTSNGSSSSFQDESNTSQNLIANMAYAF